MGQSWTIIDNPPSSDELLHYPGSNPTRNDGHLQQPLLPLFLGNVPGQRETYQPGVLVGLVAVVPPYEYRSKKTDEPTWSMVIICLFWAHVIRTAFSFHGSSSHHIRVDGYRMLYTHTSINNSKTVVSWLPVRIYSLLFVCDLEGWNNWNLTQRRFSLPLSLQGILRLGDGFTPKSRENKPIVHLQRKWQSGWN